MAERLRYYGNPPSVFNQLRSTPAKQQHFSPPPGARAFHPVHTPELAQFCMPLAYQQQWTPHTFHSPISGIKPTPSPSSPPLSITGVSPSVVGSPTFVRSMDRQSRPPPTSLSRPTGTDLVPLMPPRQQNMLPASEPRNIGLHRSTTPTSVVGGSALAPFHMQPTKTPTSTPPPLGIGHWPYQFPDVVQSLFLFFSSKMKARIQSFEYFWNYNGLHALYHIPKLLISVFPKIVATFP